MRTSPAFLKGLKLEFLSFPFLFRVSDFVLRILGFEFIIFLYLASFASLRELFFSSFCNQKFNQKISKYLCLGLLAGGL